MIITSLYAWVVTEPDGEGVAGAALMVDGKPVWMPLVGADLDRMRSLRPYAELVKEQTGFPMRLARFDLAAEEIDSL
jgi:hypothetical protein